MFNGSCRLIVGTSFCVLNYFLVSIIKKHYSRRYYFRLKSISPIVRNIKDPKRFAKVTKALSIIKKKSICLTGFLISSPILTNNGVIDNIMIEKRWINSILFIG